MATTIKVPENLRDEINRQAQADGLTAAAFIEKLLESHSRVQRMELVAQSINTADSSYWDEFEEWDSISHAS